jgi:uncharacterized protein YjbJ (UPF0337 family)
MNMNWDQLEGTWRLIRGTARLKWDELTDDDLNHIAGRRENLIGTLQQRYRIPREEAERQAEDWRRYVEREHERGRVANR